MEIKHMTMKEFKEFQRNKGWWLESFDLGFKCFDDYNILLYKVYITNWER